MEAQAAVPWGQRHWQQQSWVVLLSVSLQEATISLIGPSITQWSGGSTAGMLEAKQPIAQPISRQAVQGLPYCGPA